MTNDNGYTSLIPDYRITEMYCLYDFLDVNYKKKIGQNNYTSLIHGVI